MPWTTDVLDEIGGAEELRVSTGNRETPIWVVRVGEAVYVRSAFGRGSRWFRGTQERHEGHIRSGGVDEDVRFVDVDADDPVHDAIDAAYRAKYGGRYPDSYVDPVAGTHAREATVRIEAA